MSCTDPTSRVDAVLEAATDAYVAADAAGRIVAWNARAEETFGWRREEVVGLELIPTLVPEAARVGPLMDVPGLFELARAPASSRRVKLPLNHRDGHALPAELTVWCTVDGASPTLHALVHERMERDDARESLYRMASLVYFLDEAVLGVDPDGLIQSWNFGAERTFGYAAFEVVGKNVAFLVEEQQRRRVADWWAAMRDGRRLHRQEIAGRRKNGVVVHLDVTVSPIRDGRGQVSGGSVVARDVTEQRWTAATLERALSDLEAALKEARESEAGYRRFLADAAHQLRTPIAGIRATAETLLRVPHEEDGREALVLNVVREASRASRVMAGVLRMAMVDHGETLTFRACDVVALCADEVERASALAPTLEVGLRVEAAPPVPPKLDRHVVSEILANLLDNARRYASSRIEVVVRADRETVELAVVDDGPGLPPTGAERAFERFVTLDEKGGSGLGLPIARGLARGHGGDLVYEESFRLRLPVEAPVECGGAARPGPPPPP